MKPSLHRQWVEKNYVDLKSLHNEAKMEKKVNTMMMWGIFIQSDSRENAAWDEKCYKQTA